MSWITEIISGLSKPFKWWVTVAPWEQGLRVRLGKKSVFLAPGLHLKIPFLDRVYVQSVRVRTVTEDNLTVTSKTGKTFTISFALRIAIGDIVKLYETICDPDNTLISIVNCKLAHVVSTLDNHEIQPENLTKLVQEEVETFTRFGLIDCRFLLTEIAAPKIYRLQMNDYRNSSGIGYIEEGTGEKR